MAKAKGPLSAEAKEKIKSDAKAGKSAPEIANALNRSVDTIQAIIDGTGKPSKKKSAASSFAPHYDPIYELFKANREAVVISLLKETEKEMGFKVKNPADNGDDILQMAAEYKGVLKRAEEIKTAITALAHKA